jgi:hypothetical protein
MTTTPIWTVWCDAELTGCLYWCRETEMRASEARENARRAGWRHRRDGRDICPACWAEGAR